MKYEWGPALAGAIKIIMQFWRDKKTLIIISILILTVICFTVFLFYINRIKQGEGSKNQTAPATSQEKILTPEEEKESLLEIIRKKEESLPPGEADRRKAATEKERQELLNYLKNK